MVDKIESLVATSRFALACFATMHVLFISSGIILGEESQPSIKTPKEILTINGDARYITFSPNGKRLAGNVPGATWRPTDIKIWECSTGKELMILKGHGANIWELSFSPDGKRLASNGNFMAKVWDLDAQKEIRFVQHAGIHAQHRLHA